MRVLELFCGIGGCSVAVAGSPAEVVGAIDQSPHAGAVYDLNFAHRLTLNLASVKAPQLARFDASLWWMSPPCQPFTIRGNQRDLDDPRSAAFKRVVALLDEVRPTAVALENVVRFEGSRARALLCEVLDGAGYDVQERILCPTELGVPTRRRRYYLVASRRGLRRSQHAAPVSPRPLEDYLDAAPHTQLYLDDRFLDRWGEALAVCRADDPDAVAMTFTAAYGKSPVYAGSYLDDGVGLRRFSPRELLRLLHFPDSFALPEMRLRTAYKVIGNSLSTTAVREVLAPLW